VLQRLVVSQDKHQLVLDIQLRPGVHVHGLWAYCADTSQWWALGRPRAAPWGGPTRHRAVVDLAQTAARMPTRETTVDLFLDVEHDVEAGSEEADLITQAPHAVLADPQNDQKADTLHTRYRMRLGESVDTVIGELHTVQADDQRVTAFVSRHGYLALELNRDLDPYAAVHVRRLSLRGEVLRLRGTLLTRHGDVQHAELLLKARNSDVRLSGPIELVANEQRSRKSFGHRFYDFSATGDWGQWLQDEGLVPDIYDAWVTVTTSQAQEPFAARIGKTRLVGRVLTRAGWTEHGHQAIVVTPYYTYRAKNTTFQVDLFDVDRFRYLRRELRMRHLTRAKNWRRDVWLMGERPYKAQDTGYRFFKHMRERHPEVEAYYVIDRDSPERANVEALGNVLDFGSEEHVRAALLARKVLGSHHPDFLYPLRTKDFRRAMRATKVFLQHGVMGTKWLAPMYGKSVAEFDTDLFIVSSERERQYIVGDFGYDPDEVAVTGLSRFDSLLAGDVEVNPRQLLVMPTWRDWLQDTDAYLASDYHANWSAFLYHPRLAALVERHDLDVVLCLHPNMQRYRNVFSQAPVRLISQGEVDVQLLLKQSAMLVTDFSSVGFDFSFLHKPVAYFQFDRERFLEPQGSHLDLDDELPGPIERTPVALVEEIEARAADGFTMEPKYVRRADRFLAHRDQNSSERIYQRARRQRRARDPWKSFTSHEIVAAGLRFLRRHRWYFPAMKLMLRVLRHLPADPRSVVFESGVGLQYADSPRYIYEELVRRGNDLTMIWAYTGHIPGRDLNTKVVERLSPAYFYHLGRSLYWVNNQSFPHYVHRRPGGVYVQTWHGTPLKRMLHDLDQVFGRDSGYVGRATTAAAQWSLLVSPSPFATKAISSAFHYHGKVLEAGYPRNDLFYRSDRDELARRVRRRLGIRDDQRVVLYAPTFRDDQTVGNRFWFSLPFDLARFHERMGDDVVLLLRMHVLVAAGLEIPPELASTVLDVSKYPEIQELFLASDVLVTDYSSVLFDFANLRRPMVFFAYDLPTYRDKLRGFYLDYETDLPGPVVTTEDDLYESLLSLDLVEKEFGGRYDAFIERFSPNDDGHAAERVVDEVFGRRPQAD
jgi:CDP-glycerol glycerophosphotransferase